MLILVKYMQLYEIIYFKLNTKNNLCLKLSRHALSHLFIYQKANNWCNNCVILLTVLDKHTHRE